MDLELLEKVRLKEKIRETKEMTVMAAENIMKIKESLLYHKVKLNWLLLRIQEKNNINCSNKEEMLQSIICQTEDLIRECTAVLSNIEAIALCSGEIFKLLEIGYERKIEYFYNSIVIKAEELSKTAVKVQQECQIFEEKVKKYASDISNVIGVFKLKKKEKSFIGLKKRIQGIWKKPSY